MFQPPFCARRSCPMHYVPEGQYTAWVKDGFHATKAFGLVPRFQCLVCGKTFSVQTFRLDYWVKRILPYPDIMRTTASGMSTRASGRHFHASTGSIRNRIDRLSRQCLADHSRLRGDATRESSLAADGFESFDASQYFPNNLNILVGSRSLFLYAFSHASLRRKGRMTEEQRRSRELIDRAWKPQPDAIARSFGEILARATERWHGPHPLVLWTDRHNAYPRAVKAYPVTRHLALTGQFVHRRVSSRKARTPSNPLFPVNYFDREIRKDLANHRRETACFTRDAADGCSRFVVFAYEHNYRKPFRVRGNLEHLPEEKERRIPCHGEMAGIPKRDIESSRGELFEKRRWLSLEDITGFERRVWTKAIPTPLKAKKCYIPRFALA